MVEVVGHKLKTHHPVIEPVSDIRVGNGIFRVSVHFSHTCLFKIRTRSVLAEKIFRWRTRCRQFASGMARLFGGRTTRLGFKVSSISVSIARLTGFHQGVRQLACEVQGRATTAGAKGALSARRPKSCP
jgi:hypothetical protein